MRTPEQVEQLIERNQDAEGWLQPDQFAWNVAVMSAELDALTAEGPIGIAAHLSARQA